MTEETLPHIMHLHRVVSEAPIILDDGQYELLCYVTWDDDPLDKMEEKRLSFSLEEEAEEIINIVNSSWEPISLRVVLPSELDSMGD